MKKLFPLIACILLFSCTEDIVPEITEQPGQPVPSSGGGTYTLVVTAGKASTLDTKALNIDGTGALKATWAVGEEVSVYKADALLGTLSAQADGQSTTLKGQITGALAKDDELTLKFLSPDYASQDGTIEYISSHCDYAVANVTVTDVAGTTVTTTSAQFENQQAIVSFNLNVSANPLIVNVPNLSIMVTPSDAKANLFVAVPALSSQPVSLRATVGDKQYTLLKNSVTLEAGKYYSIDATLSEATLVHNESELTAAVQTDGAQILFANDISIKALLQITGNRTITIDMNGFTLDRGCTSHGTQAIVVRTGSKLNLSNGTVTGGWGGNGGALDIEDGTTVNLTDVIISGNKANDRGGGICIRSGGTLNMTGGAITGNSSIDNSGTPAGGGGLFIYEGSTATLTGVTISGNETEVYGGGGIDNFGTLTLDGCTITGNTSIAEGAGIWTSGSSTLNMQGTNIINDNWKTNALRSNLYLATGTVITVTGDLAGSDVSVDMQTLGTFTSGFSTYHDVSPAYFFDVDKRNITSMRLVAGEGQLSSAIPAGGVCYVERSWDEVNKKVVAHYRTWTSSEYTVLTGREEHYISYDVPGSKILVRGNVTFDGVMELTSKDVAIVLADGACLTSKGVCCARNQFNASITIYAEEGGGTLGKINADAYFSNDLSGIGEYYNSSCSVTIHGGDIYARGGKYASGIGSYLDDDDDNNTDGGDITIYGGEIEAIGAAGGAGIGSGYDVPHYGTIRIYGGTVNAKGATSLPEGIHDWHSSPGIGGGHNCQGGTTHIYGGDITAEGAWEAAGIGCSQTASSAGHIIIDGGHVVARGAENFGAGIGGGDGVSGGTIEINGGEVYAYAGDDAAGIGGGEGASGGTITITGGYVYAEGNDKGAGIGGGQDGAGGNVTITGGTVVAQAGDNDTGYRAIGPGWGSDNYGSLTLGNNMMVTSERLANEVERINMCWYRTWVRVEPCTHPGYTAEDCPYHKH